jgi:hypothetical protein
MPEAAPVIRAVRFSKRFMCDSSGLLRTRA